THDLGLAWILADRIAVMYLGKIVEQGTAEQVISHPKHPYTQALISVVPSPDPRHLVKRTILKGERPDAVNIPSGCRFHPRCPVAFERCGWSADEVAEELTSLSSGGRLPGIIGIEAQDSRAVTLRMAPGVSAGVAAATLRQIVSENRDSRLALKGVAEIRESGDAIQVTLQSWAEPPLIELGPGNDVACHLVTPPAEAVPAVTACADSSAPRGGGTARRGGPRSTGTAEGSPRATPRRSSATARGCTRTGRTSRSRATGPGSATRSSS